MPKKEIDEDKAFEQALKGKMGWKCSCSLDIVDKKSSKSAARQSQRFIFSNNLFRLMETADLVLPIIFAIEVTEKPALRR